MNDKNIKRLRFLGLTAGAAAVSAVSSYFTTKYMMKVALDRDIPKAPKGAEKLITGGGPGQDSSTPLRLSPKSLRIPRTKRS